MNQTKPYLDLKKSLLALIFLIGLVGTSSANYLADWPDDALCGWMQNPSPPEHILKEVEKRRLKCIDGIAVGIDTSIQSSELSGVQIYEITFSDELRDELLAIAPIESASDFTKSFKNYQLAFIQDKLTCAFYLRSFYNPFWFSFLNKLSCFFSVTGF